MEGCIFCMIVSGDIEASHVYEDDLVLAFEDVTPQAPVHTLVVPKQHYANMNDDVPPEVLAALFSAAAKVAEIKGVAESGYRLVVNNGPDAGQAVAHLHVHVLGGRRLADTLTGSLGA